MPRRGTAARDDLVGGGLHDAWANGQNGGNLREAPRLLGSMGSKTRAVSVARGHRRCGRGGGGAAAVLGT
jgi:hypothetical protein